MAARARERRSDGRASDTPQRRHPPLGPSRLSDADVVRRVLAGERELLELLVERHGAALYATLRARLNGAEEAREAFQEAWTLAFERLDSLRDPERFRAWLFSIALNELRRGARRPEHVLPTRDAPHEPQDLRDAAREPAELAGERELERRLAEAIAELPPRQREVFRLRVTGGLAHAEIAALLGISEENARVHHHLAVRRLRERLARSLPKETS